MKKSLLATAIITMLITATAFAGDAQAAPHRGHKGGPPAKQSMQMQKQRPPQARPHKQPSYKPAQVKQHREARPMPKQMRPAHRPAPTQVKQHPRPQVKPDVRPQSRPQPRPEMRPQGKPQPRPEQFKPNNRPQTRPEMKPNNRPQQRPEQIRPNDRPQPRPEMKPNGRPPHNNFDKDRPNSKPQPRPEMRPNDRPQSRPDVRPQDKPNHRPDIKPNDRPQTRPEMRPHGRPPHGGDIKPPHHRPPHHPPHYRHYHGRYHLYYGLFIPPIIYGGCYYETIADNDAIIQNLTYIQPSEHPNRYLTPLLREKGHPDDAVFCVTYDGQEAYQYDLRHGTGSFYRLAIENAPKAKKWKADPPTSPNPPVITCLDDLLRKYHFTPSPTALFDGKHLYKFDADNRSFVENQTIEGITTTYKHGDIYLIHATPENTHPYPKYYLILPDAIYETQADLTHGYIDFNELNHDTKKLWKIIK